VQNAVEDLADVAGALVEHEHELEVRVSGEFVFINTVRLRLDLDNYASFSQLLSLFRSSGIGSLHLHARPEVKQWQRFLAAVLVPSQDPPTTRFHQLLGRLEQQGLTIFELGEPTARWTTTSARNRRKSPRRRIRSPSPSRKT
jgi:hypothetical protein